MEALIMMIKNTKENTYHPIFYFEKEFPGDGGAGINAKIIRFKSKGHHTTGFKDRQDAMDSIQTDIVYKLVDMGYVTISKQLEPEKDIQWDGEGIPTDIQLRPRDKSEWV